MAHFEVSCKSYTSLNQGLLLLSPFIARVGCLTTYLQLQSSLFFHECYSYCVPSPTISLPLVSPLSPQWSSIHLCILCMQDIVGRYILQFCVLVHTITSHKSRRCQMCFTRVFQNVKECICSIHESVGSAGALHLCCVIKILNFCKVRNWNMCH